MCEIGRASCRGKSVDLGGRRIIKKKINLAIYNNMDLEGIMLSEISQTKKDKYCMISLICGIEKTKEMCKHNKTETEL